MSLDIWDENLVVLCQKSIFVRMTDTVFPVTGFLWRPIALPPPLPPPKEKVLEPPLVANQ